MKRATEILEFIHGPWKVLVEDDGVVAYAYLLRDDEIVGDLWLYNQGETPDVPEWKQKPAPAPPFRNAQPYVGPAHAAALPISLAEIAVRWENPNTSPAEAADDELKVEILLREKPFALLTPGARPGFSAWVVRDSPVARKLTAS